VIAQHAIPQLPLRSVRRVLVSLFLLVLGCSVPGGPSLQGMPVSESVATIPPEEGPLRVYLLSIDRGEQVYEMFGHNAILIQNLETGEALAWNWGLFNFEDVDFIPRFLRGTMRYSMGPADLDWFLQGYAIADRAVFAHKVHLTAEQAGALDAFVRWNFLPENRPYIYDYYRDNCSTRVRDALDLVLGGVLKTQFEGVDTGRSYRWFSRRQVQVTGWVDQGLSFLLGLRGDRPIDAWEAMFLPMELMRSLEAAEVRPQEEGSAPYPLLGPRETWVPSDRAPLPPSPPAPSVPLLLAGLVGGLLLTFGGWQMATGRRNIGVWVMAGISAMWGIFSGGLGLLLMAAWWTDHHFIQANMNLLQTNPIVLLPAMVLAILGIWPGLSRSPSGARVIRLSSFVGILLAAISLLTALAQGVPGLSQGNVDVLFVSLPLNLSLAGALWMGSRAPSRFPVQFGRAA